MAEHPTSTPRNEPEPVTPAWLTALGAALLVAAVLAWAVYPSSSPPEAASPAASASADAGR